MGLGQGSAGGQAPVGIAAQEVVPVPADGVGVALHRALLRGVQVPARAGALDLGKDLLGPGVGAIQRAASERPVLRAHSVQGGLRCGNTQLLRRSVAPLRLRRRWELGRCDVSGRVGWRRGRLWRKWRKRRPCVHKRQYRRSGSGKPHEHTNGLGGTRCGSTGRRQAGKRARRRKSRGTGHPRKKWVFCLSTFLNRRSKCAYLSHRGGARI